MNTICYLVANLCLKLDIFISPIEEAEVVVKDESILSLKSKRLQVKILNKLNNHYCNGEFTILLGKVFEPILLNWVLKLQTMAGEQMKILFKIQADEKEAYDISGEFL